MSSCRHSFGLAELTTAAKEEQHRAIQGFTFTNANAIKISCHIRPEREVNLENLFKSGDC